MGNFGQRLSQLNPKTVWKFGVGLFVISFVIPSGDDCRFFAGACIFAVVPDFILQGLLPEISDPNAVHVQKMDDLYQVIFLSIAWLSNILIFFRLPTFASLTAIVLLWLSCICLFPDLINFIPFYPWAFGITLIHLSGILSRRQAKIVKQSFGVTGEGFVVTAQWPGVNSNDIEITAEANQLHIVGKRQSRAVPYEFDVPVPLGYDPVRAQATCFKGGFSIIVPKTTT